MFPHAGGAALAYRALGTALATAGADTYVMQYPQRGDRLTHPAPATVTELAAGEKLDRGYLGKILMLTLLAPDIVEAIINGQQPAELGVHVLREGFPVEWGEQRRMMAVRL